MGEQATQRKPVGSAAAILLQSVFTVQVGDRERLKESEEMSVHVCERVK